MFKPGFFGRFARRYDPIYHAFMALVALAVLFYATITMAHVALQGLALVAFILWTELLKHSARQPDTDYTIIVNSDNPDAELIAQRVTDIIEQRERTRRD